jgi:sulfur-oxidizing protein SoxX
MRTIGGLVTGLLCAAASAGGAQEALRPYAVSGDAILAPLTGRAGDPVKGAALISDRQRSLCVLCHMGPFPDPHLQGTLAPDLTHVAARLSEGQIRLRIVDMRALNPSTIMPSYYKVEERLRVAAAWRGKPVLQAQDIEDIVAYLVTLKD